MPVTQDQLREANHLLKAIGWVNGANDPVRQFQRGFGFGYLVPDDAPGDITLDAMRYSAERDGACTPNFRYVEFACKTTGDISLHSRLPRGLEVIRALSGGAPITIISGHRSPIRNRQVDGSPNSLHLYGGAADTSDLPHISKVIALGIFAGIGARLSDGRTSHVDVRGTDNSVPNLYGGTPTNPTLWGYTSNGAATNPLEQWDDIKATGPGLEPLLTWKVGGLPPQPPKPPPAPPTELETLRADVDRHESLITSFNRRIVKLEQR